MRVAVGDPNRNGSAHGYSATVIAAPVRTRPVAANDNPFRFSRWRRAVAAVLVGLLVLSLVLIGAICTARAAETADIPGREMTLPSPEYPVKVEFYRAPGDAKRPTVLMLHGGGGWGGAEGRTENFRHYASELAAHGFDAYMVYYYSAEDNRLMLQSMQSRRQRAVDRFPAWAKLVSALAADVRKDALSNGRVGLVGFSNGGNLSAHVTPEDSGIGAAVVYYGGVSRVRGFTAKRYPPLLILHGEADTNQPMALGKALADQARALGGPVDFVTYPGEKHGFGADLSRPAAKDAFARAIAFLNKNLKQEE